MFFFFGSHHIGRLRVRRVRIGGFKSLADLDIRFPDDAHTPLVLIGSNGSGKSSFLQALAFIQFVARGKPQDFFEVRQWRPADIRTRVAAGANPGDARFRLLLEDDQGRKAYWRFVFGLADGRMRQEEVWYWNAGAEDDPRQVLALRPNGLVVDGEPYKGLRPEGSAVSVLDPSSFPNVTSEVIQAVRLWGEGIRALDLLSPARMRGSLRRADATDIGNAGEYLAAFLANLKPEAKSRVVQRLARFYPALEDVVTVRRRAGWVDLKVAEAYGRIGQTAVAHMSDGFMRLLGLAAVPEFGPAASTVLLDEVEDGIEPHILPGLVETIAAEADAQLVLTSHSPVLVNFADPRSVHFLARRPDGRTVAAPFTALARLSRHLGDVGPGEIWAQSDMDRVNDWVVAAQPPPAAKTVRLLPRIAARRFMEGR